MHIALVTPYFPTPTLPGGRARTARLAASLARQGQVHLFSVLTEEDMGAERERGGGSVAPYARVVTQPLEDAPSRGFEPQRVRRFPPRLTRALAAAHDASPFDAVVIVHSYAGPGIADLDDTTIVLDEPEVRSNVELRNVRADASHLVPRLYALQQWRRYERSVWSRVDAITLARSSDASTVHTQRSDTGVVVPNGVDAQRYAYVPPSRRKGDTVLFVGDMRAPATVQGVRELAQVVLPRLRVRVPTASLTLAGRNPPREVRVLESDDVRVAGSMSSVLPLYRDHAVFAIPTVAQGETTAVMEPMASGMAVVAPPTALHELPLQEGRDFLGARSPQEVADRIASILAHRDAFDEMALSARRVAESQDWEIIGDRFVRVVMATVARRRRNREQGSATRSGSWLRT